VTGHLAPRSGRALLLLVILVLAWQTATSLRPRLTTTDEIAFKAAGREWAQSGHFAAPELIGFRHLEPPAENVWFGQMPVYTFLFGVLTKLFGFGAWQSQLYDTLIHGILCLATFWITRARFPEAPPWTACLAGALLLPLTSPGRGDELAAILGSTALLVVPAVAPRQRAMSPPASSLGSARRRARPRPSSWR
jgi:4-amino-4-deoxy-L-arabinose transferase-like glycosyltransferase